MKKLSRKQLQAYIETSEINSPAYINSDRELRRRDDWLRWLLSFLKFW